MAGFFQVVLTRVHACARRWDLRILTDAYFIPLSRGLASNADIRSPDDISRIARQVHLPGFRCPVPLGRFAIRTTRLTKPVVTERGDTL
ncbi:hypothetical protein, partial [Bradyrhizobium sp. Leo170]|uniref:hypothetical protein n=1 Tax=Bradyrhizobium sp. Leo170 TaxID=1571199 RepID=UPI001A914B81